MQTWFGQGYLRRKDRKVIRISTFTEEDLLSISWSQFGDCLLGQVSTPSILEIHVLHTTTNPSDSRENCPCDEMDVPRSMTLQGVAGRANNATGQATIPAY
ncbi:hypothetical protein CISG_06665 [Coccidioides immitis RMSCC 3703]|uniref:Uncharacterized protein n=1 Tax=Coccidioides immitis RMSCC 3703 TaxID=454286 RepID=A0A0J8R171_COCIT|nr:hypothetical protein CISG_06665 [Coccidioides immitis RMSCC 3703]